MRRKVYLLMLAVIFFALISGGCGGGGGGSLGGDPEFPSLINGTWQIISGDVTIENVAISADYVQSGDISQITIKLTKNASGDKFTITLSGHGVITLDGTTSITANSVGGYFEDPDLDEDDEDYDYKDAIVRSLAQMPILMGNSEYTQVDEDEYSFPIAAGHVSIFRVTSDDPDILFWTSEGNTNYNMYLERVVEQ